jgi:hypothetical protein
MDTRSIPGTPLGSAPVQQQPEVTGYSYQLGGMQLRGTASQSLASALPASTPAFSSALSSIGSATGGAGAGKLAAIDSFR